MPHPKKCAAVVVGIDDYSFAPLSSCVNDALAIRDALVAYGMVDASRVDLFTDPVRPDSRRPTRDALARTLFDLCDSGDDIERLYFYYAGHGLLRHLDGAQTRTSSVIIPSDVTDLRTDGAKLIDLSDLAGKFSRRGPQEQVFIVDACRDMDYEREPDVGPLGWGLPPEGQQRKQAVIHSVPPMGKAEGRQGGLGVFTGYLLEALRGSGTAKDYDDNTEGYVVRVRSALDYARDQIERAMKNVATWQLYYNIPRVGGEDYDDMEPLRALQPAEVPDVPFTIHVEPEDAASTTRVEVWHRGIPLPAQSMPPRNNHQPVSLRPDRYRLKAKSASGIPQPEQVLIDIREVDAITVRILDVAGNPPAGGPPPHDGSQPDSPVPLSAITWSRQSRQAVGFGAAPDSDGGGALSVPSGDSGRLIAAALEQVTRVEIESLQPPSTRLTGWGKVEAELPAGAYEVRFRLGTDVFSKVQVYLDAGEELNVSPMADLSPLVAEVVGTSEAGSILVSETIGNIQAALTPTLLTLVGLKSFDPGNTTLHRFQGVVPLHDARDYHDRPIVVVLAYDGSGWKQEPRTLLRSARIRVARHAGGERPIMVPLTELLAETLASQQSPTEGRGATEGRGFQRIGVAILEAPADSFRVDLQSEEFGTASIATASVDGRVTVVTLNLHPDGRLDVTQSMLRLPGVDYPNEYVSDASPGRIVRDLMLGQQLYRSNELLTAPRVRGRNDLLTELLYAKWTDPMVTTMALLAEHRRRQESPSGRVGGNEEGRLQDWEVAEALRNLVHFFSSVPDVRVVDALFNDPRPAARGEAGPATEASYRSLLGIIRLVADAELPVLQDAARALRSIVNDLGLSHPLLEETVRRARPGDVWTVRASPEDASDLARLEYAVSTAAQPLEATAG
ncbi:MAG: caspase family protein [Gemmatimonadaceae bacterium]